VKDRFKRSESSLCVSAPTYKETHRRRVLCTSEDSIKLADMFRSNGCLFELALPNHTHTLPAGGVVRDLNVYISLEALLFIDMAATPTLRHRQDPLSNKIDSSIVRATNMLQNEVMVGKLFQTSDRLVLKHRTPEVGGG